MRYQIGMAFLAISVVLASCNNADKSPKGIAGGNGLQTAPSPTTTHVKSPPAIELPKPDRSVPTTSYTELNKEPAGTSITYIVSAKSSTRLNDDQKLNLFSPSYYHQPDAFKKKDIAQTELPRIDSALETYRTQNYYSLPLNQRPQANQPLQLTNISLGQYDFKSKAFPLRSYGQYCWAGSIRNQQGVSLKILPSDIPCLLSVADETQAKQIEAARAQNALGLEGTIYLFIPIEDRGTALAVVSQAHVTLRNVKTGETLARFEL